MPLMLKPNRQQDVDEGQTEHQEKSTANKTQEIILNGLTTGAISILAASFVCSGRSRKEPYDYHCGSCTFAGGMHQLRSCIACSISAECRTWS